MSKDEVINLYVKKNMNLNEVVKILKVNRTVLINFLVKNNITKENNVEEARNKKYEKCKEKFNSSEIKINEW